MIAIPVVQQSDHTDLRFALRSFEKFLPEQEVLILGEAPDWITRVTQICIPDIRGRKQLSIRKKILAALEYSKEILFLNDDIYLLEPWKEFDYYSHGTLAQYNEPGSKPLLNELKGIGKPLVHFDGHFPIVYTQEFKEVSKYFSSDCIIKSMYCNFLEIEGKLIEDCKIHRQEKPQAVRDFITGKKCFSTTASSLPSTLFILEELFPQPSKYEIW